MALGLVGLGTSIIGGIRGDRAAKKNRARMGRTIANYRASRPEGYLTQGDYEQAGRVREGYGTLARQKGGQRTGQLITRYRQLGLDASQPGIVTRGLDRISEDVADTTLQGTRAADEGLYATRMSREEAQREKERDIFGAEMGLHEADQRRGEAKYAAFMNGLNEFFPSLTGFYGRNRLGGKGLPNDSLRAASQWDSTQPRLTRRGV